MTDKQFNQFVARLRDTFGERSVDSSNFQGVRSIYIRGSKFNPPDKNNAILVFHFTSHSENIDGQLYSIALSLPLLAILNEFEVEMKDISLQARI